MAKVIGVGDNVCDKYIHSGIMYPGGQAMNFSIYAKMLGATSAYLGVLGDDSVAEHIMDTLEEFNVDYSRCRKYHGENGYAKIRIVEGNREFIMSNRGGVLKDNPIELKEEDIEYLKGFDLVHTSNNSYFDSQLRTLKDCGVEISYDFSGRWKEPEWVDRVAPHITYALLSCSDESKEEVKEICNRMYQKGVKFTIATRGSEGAILFDGENFYEQTSKKIEVIDTLGAGDSFATAFLVSFIDSYKKGNLSKEEALKKALEGGAEFAAKTCGVQGAYGHGVPMIKMYGSDLCPHCQEVFKEIKDKDYPIEFRNFNEKLRNLRDFLKIREENSEAFEAEKKENKIGIPFFVLEDGSFTKKLSNAIKSIDKK